MHRQLTLTHRTKTSLKSAKNFGFFGFSFRIFQISFHKKSSLSNRKKKLSADFFLANKKDTTNSLRTLVGQMFLFIQIK